MLKCKITFLKQAQHTELMAKYENPIGQGCDLKVGQTFISIDGKMPKGFCPNAWVSVGPYVKALAEGKENFFDGWMLNKKSAMISCNDGFRPASFLIEVIPD